MAVERYINQQERRVQMPTTYNNVGNDTKGIPYNAGIEMLNEDVSVFTCATLPGSVEVGRISKTSKGYEF